MTVTLPQAGLTGAAKLKAVTELVDILTKDLAKPTLSLQQRDSALDILKVYGRDSRNADPIFTKQGIDTLTRHAFTSTSSTTSRNAQRVLANALFLKPETRQMFVDLGYEAKACSKLKSGNLDDEFLVSRIIFFTTYNTTVSLPALIDQYKLADAISQNLQRHAKIVTAKAGSAAAPTDPMVDMALTETAKLLFNVTHFCTDHIDAFTPSIAPIVTLVCKHALPSVSKPLDPPMGSLITGLLTLNLESKEGIAALFPKSETTALVDRLAQLLDLSLHKYRDAELDQTVLPVLTSLHRIVELTGKDKDKAEKEKEKVRAALQTKLLPTADDRNKVLGRSDSLPSILLRHMTNALAPNTRESVSHLLFELSDKDASKFIENVGYGYASGFLFQNNVPLPEGAMEAHRAETAGSGRGRAYNAVTGQYLDQETQPDMPAMTDEEKEREAERLFVLFERLKKTGIVDIENPVATAMREGRFEKKGGDSGRVEELD